LEAERLVLVRQQAGTAVVVRPQLSGILEQRERGLALAEKPIAARLEEVGLEQRGIERHGAVQLLHGALIAAEDVEGEPFGRVSLGESRGKGDSLLAGGEQAVERDGGIVAA